EPASFLYPDDNNPSLTQSGFGFGGFVVPVVAEERLELAGTSNGLNMNIPEIDFGGGENGYFPNSVPVTVPLTINQSQVSSGGGDIGDYVSPVRLTVFINDMPFDVAAGLFNVKEAFGNNAMLINSFGQPILTDEFGVTFQPLQNGAVYYLL
ncbi:BnaAnng35160D, partial [Brassica napus]